VIRLQDVHTYYGDSHILKGISFEVGDGELATLLGRNGAGKSTTLKSIMGLVPPKEGSIIFGDKDIFRQNPHQIASLGVGYIPEDRGIFASLSVLENLNLPIRRNKQGLWNLEKIYSYFPILKERVHHKGSELSGGEQQMLAIARILTMDIKLMLLDEPTEGLAPFLVHQIAMILQEIMKSGISILLVEQNTRFAIEVADRHYIIYSGQIVYKGSNDQFESDKEIQARYLGV
jgi:branched-chain amino acid transport system ATP-binding protein